jgi:hypothetical protein
MTFHDLDCVALTRAIDDPQDGHFPAGTGGAIVHLGEGWALVEVGREDGSSAGLIQVLLDDLRLDERVAAA